MCHREIDVTHPRFFATQKPDGRKGKPPPSPPADPGDVGQPGFTPNERARFERLVTAHALVDAYRRCVGDVKDAMTWMGHPGVVSVGKYRGMGMRLDYFMLEGWRIASRRASKRRTGWVSRRCRSGSRPLSERSSRCTYD